MAADGGRAIVNVFDGTRQLYSDKSKLLITVIDGNQKEQSRKFYEHAEACSSQICPCSTTLATTTRSSHLPAGTKIPDTLRSSLHRTCD